MALITFVSFRLGGSDGVSIEADKWMCALRALGHRVTSVAGQGEADLLLPGLAIGACDPPTVPELHTALRDADVVVVENLASLPLNLGARDVLYDAVEGRPTLFHHHDLSWQRPHLAHLEGPRDGPRWHHVTINELSRRELGARGIHATTIMNTFDCEPPTGRRDVTRHNLELSHEVLVVMPSRALARKNIPGALELCRELNATFWLLGPAEDGYEEELDALVRRTRVDVRRGLGRDDTIHDAYAASDLVVMPSTWEGFGNPVLESVTHRRPLALYPYPVAREISSYGFRFFELGEVDAIRAFLHNVDDDLFDRNLSIARKHFNVTTLPARLGAVLDQMNIGA